MTATRSELSLYTQPLDENCLFERGAASWRTDIATYRTLEQQVLSAGWCSDENKDTASDIPLMKYPLGMLNADQEEICRDAIAAMLNDPSLVPNLKMLGVFQVGGIELQNGSLDHSWHHDGLAGRRHGHAGDFFCITYFSEPNWDDEWGGHFEYGARPLQDEWPMSGFSPKGEISRIAPAARTSLLGWNQNPCFVHRSAPQTDDRNRITMIASVNLVARQEN